MRSVQSAMLLAFSVLVLLTVIIMGLVAYTLAEDSLVQTARDYTAQLISQARQGIDTYIDHMQDISEVVVRNASVKSLARDGSGDKANVEALLSSIQQTRDDISLMLILDSQLQPVFHNSELELNPAVEPARQEWYRRALEAHGRSVISSARVQNIVRDRYPWVITLSRTIDAGSEAVFVIDLNFRVIEEMIERVELGRRGYIFVLDEDGELVFHPQQQLIYGNLRSERIEEVMQVGQGSFKITVNDDPMLYTVDRSERTGWRIVGVNYVDELLHNRQAMQWYYALWALVCFAAVILISVILASQISRPLRALRESMRAVEEGNFALRLENRWHNEIGDLANDFNLMLDTIDRLIRENEREQEAKRISELRALQNQITPHFLYNTLDSIIWMADAKRFEDVIEMTSALARLLRLSIRQGDELVTVSDEIEHVASYLQIQCIRYRDNLDYSIDVEPGTTGHRTLKVLLQPIVENAIYHGLRERDGDGHVAIRCYTNEECLVFEVEDNGVGIDRERAVQLLEEDAGTDEAERRPASVGLRNVHERVRLYYGSDFGVSFETCSAGGTRVRITQPLVGASQGVLQHV